MGSSLPLRRGRRLSVGLISVSRLDGCPRCCATEYMQILSFNGCELYGVVICLLKGYVVVENWGGREKKGEKGIPVAEGRFSTPEAFGAPL